VKPAPATERRVSDRVPVACLAVFLVVWGALAIAPRYREDWLLENLPVFLAVPVAIATYRRFRFSDRAYVQMTMFLVLHSVGAHYTYSEVPLGGWVSDALGWSRNHYDRFVHLAFGVLLLRPVRELAFPDEPDPGRLRALLLSVAGIAALSVGYEIVEWLTASMVDPEAGTAFLGTQGDEWDAQKDMSLATGGAVLAAAFERLSPDARRAATRVPS
jgi:putative membrane protein